jgi:hypothetical protein
LVVQNDAPAASIVVDVAYDVAYRLTNIPASMSGSTNKFEGLSWRITEDAGELTLPALRACRQLHEIVPQLYAPKNWGSEAFKMPAYHKEEFDG